MENVNIWFFTDNDHGLKTSDLIRTLGLTVNTIKDMDFTQANTNEDEINITIFDIEKPATGELIKEIAAAPALSSFPKFIFVPEKEINNILKKSYNILHLEFISKPTNRREFLLLLEKSIIVERYREMMSFISDEAEIRIEAYESLMNIHRKDIFTSEKEKGAFEKILSHEKNLLREQTKLNNAIREFTLLRQSEYFDLKNRIQAEEMLSFLRRKEMIDAKNVIDAQESVLDYSAQERDGYMKIISATETVAELSRNEALELHQKLKDLTKINEQLNREADSLRKEIEKLKKK